MQTSSPILVVGLGNPGNEYAKTRHNLGFQAVEELAARWGGTFKSKFAGAFAKVAFGGRGSGRDVVLLRPETYMNESGRSVQPAAAFFHAAMSDIVVLHDELDLPLGEVRIKVGGGHAGHNGIRSLIEHLGGPDFVRVRMGVSRPAVLPRDGVADYVLAPFAAGEVSDAAAMVKLAADAVEKVVSLGTARAMLEVHSRAGTKPRDPSPSGAGSAPSAPSAPSARSATAKPEKQGASASQAAHP